MTERSFPATRLLIRTVATARATRQPSGLTKLSRDGTVAEAITEMGCALAPPLEPPFTERQFRDSNIRAALTGLRTLLGLLLWQSNYRDVTSTNIVRSAQEFHELGLLPEPELLDLLQESNRAMGSLGPSALNAVVTVEIALSNALALLNDDDD